MFGFLKGKMKITLVKYNYVSGENIEGNLMFTLKKPAEARELTISFTGYQQERRRTSNGTSTSWRKIHDFKMPLDGAKSFSSGQEYTYPFKITIPTNLIPKGEINPTLQSIAKVASMFVGTSTAKKWYVEGRLNMPGFDLNKKVQINIT